MFDRILLLDNHSALGECIAESLTAEGYRVDRRPSVDEARRVSETDEPDAFVVNGVAHSVSWLADVAAVEWMLPVITLSENRVEFDTAQDWQWVSTPFAFQDLLFVVQNALYQRTLSGRDPFEIGPVLVNKIEHILATLREQVRARCVVLSSSSGRLINTVGAVDQSIAISLAALMSGSFSASAKAAQLLGQGDMFDSNLQESEGYGLYAILLRDKLILTVAFSSKITIGMVRHYVAQAALDILDALMHEMDREGLTAELDMDVDFRETVVQALGDLLGG